MTATIVMEGLVKQYPNGVRGVDGVDLSIDDGEFFALLGPSGCGKTTLLRSIAGLETITEGTLRIGGTDMTDVEPGRRGVAMVFQDYALFPHMDVSDNIAYPLRIRRVARTQRRRAAADTAQRLSLAELLERRPAQLSGGQQQRVALARAIATRPDVLLLDEPLSNLDARLRLEARTFLKELQRDLGVTSVFVTHDQAEALALADRIAVMRRGRIQQVGTPGEVFHGPANEFVASFIGSHPMNLNDGVIRGGAIESLGARIALPRDMRREPAEGTRVRWGVRPEYVRWSDDDADDGQDRPIGDGHRQRGARHHHDQQEQRDRDEDLGELHEGHGGDRHGGRHPFLAQVAQVEGRGADPRGRHDGDDRGGDLGDEGVGEAQPLRAQGHERHARPHPDQARQEGGGQYPPRVRLGERADDVREVQRPQDHEHGDEEDGEGEDRARLEALDVRGAGLLGLRVLHERAAQLPQQVRPAQPLVHGRGQHRLLDEGGAGGQRLLALAALGV